MVVPITLTRQDVPLNEGEGHAETNDTTMHHGRFCWGGKFTGVISIDYNDGATAGRHVYAGYG